MKTIFDANKEAKRLANALNMMYFIYALPNGEFEVSPDENLEGRGKKLVGTVEPDVR